MHTKWTNKTNAYKINLTFSESEHCVKSSDGHGKCHLRHSGSKCCCDWKREGKEKRMQTKGRKQVWFVFDIFKDI